MDSIGEEIARNDFIINENLENLIDKEEEIKKQYITLKNMQSDYQGDLKTKFEQLLEKRKLFIEYKLQTKSQQIKSLYKLLEYFNTLEDKKREFDTELILKKINELQKIYNNYNSINLD